jgi:hypothetical protein
MKKLIDNIAELPANRREQLADEIYQSLAARLLGQCTLTGQ